MPYRSATLNEDDDTPPPPESLGTQTFKALPVLLDEIEQENKDPKRKASVSMDERKAQIKRVRKEHATATSALEKINQMETDIIDMKRDIKGLKLDLGILRHPTVQTGTKALRDTVEAKIQDNPNDSAASFVLPDESSANSIKKHEAYAYAVINGAQAGNEECATVLKDYGEAFRYAYGCDFFGAACGAKAAYRRDMQGYL